MPKFLYSIIFIVGLMWWYLIRTVITTKPEGATSIMFFLSVLLVSLGLTLSFPFYFYFYQKAQTYTNLRMVYRRALKWGFYLSIGVVFVLGMRALHVFSLINLALFLVLYFAIFLQIKGKR
jgi:hypothetical protein